MERTPADGAEAAPELLRLVWASTAALAIAPLQDLLNLGRGARMNVPRRADGNWRWRCPEGSLSGPQFPWLRELTAASKRCWMVKLHLAPPAFRCSPNLPLSSAFVHPRYCVDGLAVERTGGGWVRSDDVHGSFRKSQKSNRSPFVEKSSKIVTSVEGSRGVLRRNWRPSSVTTKAGSECDRWAEVESRML